MAGAFRPRSIIVTGGNGFTGSNFGHYTAESPNDNSIAGPGPFLRINGGGARSSCSRPFAGMAEPVLRSFAARSISDVLNSARCTYLDTYNSMYL